MAAMLGHGTKFVIKVLALSWPRGTSEILSDQVFLRVGFRQTFRKKHEKYLQLLENM
jgi:hypothetical protein